MSIVTAYTVSTDWTEGKVALRVSDHGTGKPVFTLTMTPDGARLLVSDLIRAYVPLMPTTETLAEPITKGTP